MRFVRGARRIAAGRYVSVVSARIAGTGVARTRPFRLR
jgi:hypothetical protein